MDQNRGNGFLLGLGSIMFILLVWSTLSFFQILPKLFLPSPIDVWNAFIELSTEGYRGTTLFQNIYISIVQRVLFAFTLAIVTAIPIGLLMGMSYKVEKILNPIIEFYRPLPPLAYYTLLIIWFGIDEVSKLALLYLAAFPILVINSAAGVRTVRNSWIEAGKTYGVNKWQMFHLIVLPAALPQIFTGIRASIGVTYTTLVAAEIVAANSGLGWMVLSASEVLRTPIVWLGIILMGITGVLLDYLVRLLEKKLVPWQGHY